MQADHQHLVGPRPSGMRGDDLELGEVGGEVVERGQGPRHVEPPAEAPRRARAHAGRADVDEHGYAELRDLLEEWTQFRVVDREVAADRMEVKADETEVVDGVFRLLDRLRAFP